mgnify:CR=1 FL=1
MNEHDKPPAWKRAGIRYPGDDGTEPPEVREAKAQAYAAEVTDFAYQNAIANFQAAEKARRGWRNLWGWL